MGGSIGGLQTQAEKNEAAIYSALITLCTSMEFLGFREEI